MRPTNTLSAYGGVVYFGIGMNLMKRFCLSVVSMMFVSLLVVSNSFAETYDCTFTHINTPNGLEKETLKLTFAISEIDDKAQVIGNTGISSAVVHIDRGFGKTFIEITGVGNVMTTTFDKKMNAVHSRNSIGLLGELIPSQFYGQCAKR